MRASAQDYFRFGWYSWFVVLTGGQMPGGSLANSLLVIPCNFQTESRLYWSGRRMWTRWANRVNTIDWRVRIFDSERPCSEQNTFSLTRTVRISIDPVNHRWLSARLRSDTMCICRNRCLPRRIFEKDTKWESYRSRKLPVDERWVHLIIRFWLLPNWVPKWV